MTNTKKVDVYLNPDTNTPNNNGAYKYVFILLPTISREQILLFLSDNGFNKCGDSL
jgi:hypothetical protein